MSKAVVLLLLSSCALAQVAVSTKLTGSDGNAVTGAFLRFSLQNCGPNFPIYANTPLVIVKRSVDMPVNGNGQVVGQILPNDLITCGNVASTQWLVQPMRDASTPLNAAQCYIIHSTDYAAYGGLTAAFDPAVAQPCSTTPPAPGFIPIFSNPVGSQTWRQPTNTTGFFQGNFDFTGATVTGLNVAASLFPNCPSGLNSMAVYTGATTLGCVAAAGSDSSGNVFGLSFTAGGSNNGALFVVGGLPDPSIGSFPLQTFGWLARPFFTSSYFCRVPNTPAGAGDVGKVLALNSWDGTNKICDLAWVTQGQGIADPGVNGIVFRSAFNTSRVATSADVIALFTGTCDSTHALFGDGTCKSISTSFSGLTSGVNVQANMQVGSGSLLTPTGQGSIVNTFGPWAFNPDPFPSTGPTTWTSANTGGSLFQTHNYAIQYTLVSTVGETAPTATLTKTPGNFDSVCTGGSTACTITLPAPVIPAGYTGYTVYAGDSTNAQSPQKLAGCTNISTSCTFGSIPTTSGPPSSNAVVPSPALAKTSVCPPHVTPVGWIPDGNGNLNSDWYISEYYNAAGGPGTAVNAGIMTRCRPMWETDMQVDPPAGKNAFHVINHQFGNGGFNSSGNQERALWITGATPANDSASRFGIAALQIELDNNCNGCNFTGSPDGEVAVLSLQNSDLAATNYTAGTLGPEVVRAQYFKNGAGAVSSTYYVMNSIFTLGNKTFFAGTQGVVYNSGCTNNAGGTVANFACVGFKYTPIADANKPSNGQYGLYWANGAGFTPTLGTDWFLRNDQANLASEFGGSLVAPSTIANSGTYTFGGSMNLTGGFKTSQMATPVATASCATAGSTTFTFTVVAVDVNGNSVPSATITTLANCASDITATNKVRISITGPVSSGGFGNVIGTDHFDFYFTSAGGGTCNGGACILGKVASCTPGFAASVVYGKCPSNSIGNSGIDYTGTAGDGSSAPTANTTGGMVGYNFGTLTNCAAVGTAASPSVASCANASAGSFSCATNATGATCTVNTTAVTANSQIFVQEDETLGTKLGVTCNTSTNVLPASRLLNARVAGTSFTINLGTVTTNPACFSYFLVN